jgi:UDP-2,4-diacetamido-2,4,6-trideoxy-beta-L-altropyranose hydrolase
MIAFRADANSEIGVGHVMRCIAIASELEHMGKDTVMITADRYPAELIKSSGLRHISLESDWRLLPSEAGLLTPLFKKLHITLLLIDSYLVSAEYIKRLGSSTAIAYMDDIFPGVFPADIVINCNITCNREKYEAAYKASGTKLLLGTEYVPLRQEFRGIRPPPVRDSIGNIFITAGGSPQSITSSIIERLLVEDGFDGVRYVAASGIFSDNGRLKELSKNHPQITLADNPRSIKEAMLNCDAAVSAGGSTLYELCACGVPAAVFSFAGNQTGARKTFGDLQVMYDCGDIRDGEAKCFNNIVISLKSLKDSFKRAMLRERERKIADGFGAARIARALADYGPT